MAKVIENRFLVIEGKAKEFMQAGFGAGPVINHGKVNGGAFAGFTSIEIEGGQFMVCDTCNKDIKPEESCYYISVLNRIFCKDCFENWHSKATYYPEDARFERMHHRHTITLLRNAGVEVEEQEKAGTV